MKNLNKTIENAAKSARIRQETKKKEWVDAHPWVHSRQQEIQSLMMAGFQPNIVAGEDFYLDNGIEPDVETIAQFDRLRCDVMDNSPKRLSADAFLSAMARYNWIESFTTIPMGEVSLPTQLARTSPFIPLSKKQQKKITGSNNELLIHSGHGQIVRQGPNATTVDEDTYLALIMLTRFKASLTKEQLLAFDPRLRLESLLSAIGGGTTALADQPKRYPLYFYCFTSEDLMSMLRFKSRSKSNYRACSERMSTIEDVALSIGLKSNSHFDIFKPFVSKQTWGLIDSNTANVPFRFPLIYSMDTPLFDSQTGSRLYFGFHSPIVSMWMNDRKKYCTQINLHQRRTLNSYLAKGIHRFFSSQPVKEHTIKLKTLCAILGIDRTEPQSNGLTVSTVEPALLRDLPAALEELKVSGFVTSYKLLGGHLDSASNPKRICIKLRSRN